MPSLSTKKIQPPLHGMPKGAREEDRRWRVAHEGPAQVVHRLLPVDPANGEGARLASLVEVALRVRLDGR
eukprot:2294146-Pyramimonas_sp.AAC.1